MTNHIDDENDLRIHVTHLQTEWTKRKTKSRESICADSRGSQIKFDLLITSNTRRITLQESIELTESLDLAPYHRFRHSGPKGANKGR
jgi:hypothetical protein